MVFCAVGADAPHGDTGGVGSVPELAGYLGDFATSSRSEWICANMLNSGAVVYVFCVWADLFLVS